MGNTSKRTYGAPTLVEYGKLEEITRGSGMDIFDFGFGHVDGNIFGIPDPKPGHGSSG